MIKLSILTLFTFEYVPDWFKTQEICDKAVDKCPFVFDSIPDQYKIYKMCDQIISEDPFKVKILLS